MSQDSARVEEAALKTEREPNPVLALLRTSVGRNAGLVVALVLICIVGSITAGSRFADWDNATTILRLAAVTGVVSIGMTFVIIGGGIDLSVGAIVALSSVWCTTVATQQLAEDTSWVWMVAVALLVGSACGLINGLLIAYGNIVPFIMTLAMLASATTSPALRPTLVRSRARTGLGSRSVLSAASSTRALSWLMRELLP